MEKFKVRVVNWEKYQHYKKKNKNFNNEQPWFMFYGRKLLNDVDFMTLPVVERDFLIVCCWAVGSQDNGFLPDIEQHAFRVRRPIEEVKSFVNVLLEKKWLELWSEEDYIKKQSSEIIEDNELMEENLVADPI